MIDAAPEAYGAGGDDATKEIGGPRPKNTTAGHGDAPRTPRFGPVNRRDPLPLEVRTSRPVVEPGLQLPPLTSELDPGKGIARGGRIRRNRDDDRTNVARRTARVVTSDAFGRRGSQIERFSEKVCVRTGCWMHAQMRAVDD